MVRKLLKPFKRMSRPPPLIFDHNPLNIIGGSRCSFITVHCNVHPHSTWASFLSFNLFNNLVFFNNRWFNNVTYNWMVAKVLWKDATSAPSAHASDSLELLIKSLKLWKCSVIAIQFIQERTIHNSSIHNSLHWLWLGKMEGWGQGGGFMLKPVSISQILSSSSNITLYRLSLHPAKLIPCRYGWAAEQHSSLLAYIAHRRGKAGENGAQTDIQEPAQHQQTKLDFLLCPSLILQRYVYYTYYPIHSWQKECTQLTLSKRNEECPGRNYCVSNPSYILYSL